MTESRIALVSGANKGLGWETCRQLASMNITVLMGVRDMARGRLAASRLHDMGLPVKAVLLDVTRADHIAQVKADIENDCGRLDILVNNAGMLHGDERSLENSSATVSLQALRQTFEVNFFGAVALTQALLPLIRRSTAGRIVNISSILGSLSLHSDDTSNETQIKPLAYDASKSALNQFTIHLAALLGETPIKVNSAHPGWVKTDLGSQRAPMDAVDGAATAVRLATLGSDGPSGQFVHANETIPW